MMPTYQTIAEWIAREALPCSLAAPETCDAAIDALIAALGDRVDVLGFGEALHGGEELLQLRNRLFRRLVEAHGYRAIAIESSFPWSRAVNEYVAGGGPATYEAVHERGISHGFGRLDANRQLVEWMRRYNADPAQSVKLHFYGFDMPAAAAGPISPRGPLYFVLDYFAAIDRAAAQEQRQRIDPLLGSDIDWENPMVWLDPAGSAELVAVANALQIAIENLIVALRIRRPELVIEGGAERYREALHYAAMAREHLNFFVALTAKSGYEESLGVRDALMADNLAYIAECERGRGKVLAFAHNSHLQRGKAEMPTAIGIFRWWPAGAHLDAMLGARYAVIGTAVGVSEANGIGQPEVDTLEARLTSAPGPVRFIPTNRGQGLPTAALAALPIRSRGSKNPSYVAALSPRSLTDFDWLAVLDTATYSHGGLPLP
jgi:erythromycin esterase